MKLLNLAASGFLLFGASCAGAAGFKAENVDMPYIPSSTDSVALRP